MSSFAYSDADGVPHEVVVRRTPTGDWQVLDTCGGGTYVIETLKASDDDHAQAEAVARDYIDEGRFLPWAGTPRGDAIPERGGADADSDRRPRSEARHTRARGAALPHPAR